MGSSFSQPPGVARCKKGIAGGGGGRWKEIDREAGKSQLVLLMTIRIVNDRGVAIIIFLSGGGVG